MMTSNQCFDEKRREGGGGGAKDPELEPPHASGTTIKSETKFVSILLVLDGFNHCI